MGTKRKSRGEYEKLGAECREWLSKNPGKTKKEWAESHGYKYATVRRYLSDKVTAGSEESVFVSNDDGESGDVQCQSAQPSLVRTNAHSSAHYEVPLTPFETIEDVQREIIESSPFKSESATMSIVYVVSGMTHKKAAELCGYASVRSVEKNVRTYGLIRVNAGKKRFLRAQLYDSTAAICARIELLERLKSVTLDDFVRTEKHSCPCCYSPSGLPRFQSQAHFDRVVEAYEREHGHKDPDKRPPEPDPTPGLNWRPREEEPDPNCLECRGKGEIHTYTTPTSHYTAEMWAVLDKAKETKYGTEYTLLSHVAIDKEISDLKIQQAALRADKSHIDYMLARFELDNAPMREARAAEKHKAEMEFFKDDGSGALPKIIGVIRPPRAASVVDEGAE